MVSFQNGIGDISPKGLGMDIRTTQKREGNIPEKLKPIKGRKIKDRTGTASRIILKGYYSERDFISIPEALPKTRTFLTLLIYIYNLKDLIPDAEEKDTGFCLNFYLLFTLNLYSSNHPTIYLKDFNCVTLK
jgi:hypothetical protein